MERKTLVESVGDRDVRDRVGIHPVGICCGRNET